MPDWMQFFIFAKSAESRVVIIGDMETKMKILPKHLLLQFVITVIKYRMGEKYAGY